MNAIFESIHNHHELAVFAAITEAANRYPLVTHGELLPDVACVALNRLAPRYIRHKVDMAFYLTERERSESELAISDAVTFGVAYFARELSRSFFGWPFSFWVAAQGALIVYVVLIWAYGWAMNRLDQRFRLSEDD